MREKSLGYSLRLGQHIESIEPIFVVFHTARKPQKTKTQLPLGTDFASPAFLPSMVHIIPNAPKNFLEGFEASCHGGSPRPVTL